MKGDKFMTKLTSQRLDYCNYYEIDASIFNNNNTRA